MGRHKAERFSRLERLIAGETGKREPYTLLEESGPAQEAYNRPAVREKKADEIGRRQITGVPESTMRVAYTVCFHPPAQERGSPRSKEIWPRQTKRHEDHAQAEHITSWQSGSVTERRLWSTRLAATATTEGD